MARTSIRSPSRKSHDEADSCEKDGIPIKSDSPRNVIVMIERPGFKIDTRLRLLNRSSYKSTRKLE